MVFEYINFIVSLLILILVGFIGFAVKNLKGVTAALKDAFESMKISAQYVKAVQEIGKSLYDPYEIEKLIKLRVEAATSEIRAADEKNILLLKEIRTTDEKNILLLKDLQKDLQNQANQLKNELTRDFGPLATFVFGATTFLGPDYLDYIIRMASEGGDPELLKNIVQLAQRAFAEKGYKLPVKIEGFR
jgi:hypothetical protein